MHYSPKGGAVMKSLFRMLSVILGVFSAAVFSVCIIACASTPQEISVCADSGAYFCGYPLTVRCGELPAAADPNLTDTGGSGEIMLFGVIPVKEVSLHYTERPVVSLGGNPFGIRLYTDGLIVSRVTDVETTGGTASPAKDAGICEGDILLSANGERLRSSTQLSDIVASSPGGVVFTGKRDGRSFRTTVSPVTDCAVDMLRIGLWVRDSCAGIGMITFTDKQNRAFAGLGHGIFDSDSGRIMPLADGDIVPAEITGVSGSTAGSPGTLCGSFTSGTSSGLIASNSEKGIYGFLSGNAEYGEDIPVAFRQEVHRGKAQICTTISGTHPQFFDAVISDISYDNTQVTKNIVIRITDSRLLSATGGIVQGMSGSPIIQDGALVGAVTHVFVNDPTCGYGIFAENMKDYCNGVIQKNQLFAS